MEVDGKVKDVYIHHPELWSKVVVKAWEKSDWSFCLKRNLPAELRF